MVGLPSNTLMVNDRAEPWTSRLSRIWRKYTKTVSACSPWPSNPLAWTRRRSELAIPKRDGSASTMALAALTTASMFFGSAARTLRLDSKIPPTSREPGRE